MQSLILIALMQAAMGEPAAPPAEAPAAETTTSAPAQPAAPVTERRRVCVDYPAATGGRLQRRRCRWEEVVVETPAPEATATTEETHTDHSQHTDNSATGGTAPNGAATPAPQTP